jgi:hypothetical protein
MSRCAGVDQEEGSGSQVRQLGIPFDLLGRPVVLLTLRDTTACMARARERRCGSSSDSRSEHREQPITAQRSTTAKPCMPSATTASRRYLPAPCKSARNSPELAVCVGEHGIRAACMRSLAGEHACMHDSRRAGEQESRREGARSREQAAGTEKVPRKPRESRRPQITCALKPGERRGLDSGR